MCRPTLGSLIPLFLFAALLPISAPAFILDNHRHILMETLYRGTLHYGDATVSFSLDAVQDIDTEQGALDRVDALVGDPVWHFDEEKLQESNAKAIELRASAIERLKKGHPDAGDIKAARAAIGKGLHVIQDFYAHSNWVEMGKTDINPDLGIRALKDPLADSSTRVCDNGAYLAGTTKLTSGYPRTVPTGKCAHGNSSSGLNKDTAAKAGFEQAQRLAIKATKAYVESILNQPEILNNPTAVKQLTGR